MEPVTIKTILVLSDLNYRMESLIVSDRSKKITYLNITEALINTYTERK